jgi:hypothetical protein
MSLIEDLIVMPSPVSSLCELAMLGISGASDVPMAQVLLCPAHLTVDILHRPVSLRGNSGVHSTRSCLAYGVIGEDSIRPWITL